MTGQVPNWVRKNHGKTAKLADGGEPESPVQQQGVRQGEDPRGPSFSVQGAGQSSNGVVSAGGRASARFDLDKDSDLTVGVSGHAVKGNNFKQARVDAVDASYRKKDNEFSVSLGKEPNGGNRVMLGYRKTF